MAALAAGTVSLSLPAAAQNAYLPADAAVSAAGSEAAPVGRDDGRRTLGKFPVNLVRGIGGVFSRDSLPPFLIGAAATGAGALLDDEVRDAIADEGDDLADFADDNLGPTGLGVVTLGLFIGGRYSGNTRFRAMTYDLGVATFVNLGYTGVLKAAVSRERPNESDDDSFPSGHTSNAFALASVADAHYGRKVGIPAYLLASLVGASRLRSNAHWLSDVVAGAALGHIVGRAVVRQNDKPLSSGEKAEKRVTFMPVLTAGFRGVTVGVSF
jgi:membrane-associated phospholipid phosphatase